MQPRSVTASGMKTMRIPLYYTYGHGASWMRCARKRYGRKCGSGKLLEFANIRTVEEYSVWPIIEATSNIVMTYVRMLIITSKTDADGAAKLPQAPLNLREQAP